MRGTCFACSPGSKPDGRSGLESTLSYRIPEAPRKRTLLHIPESHTLFAGPSSCMRRHSLAARQYGNIENISCLCITQADVISGNYEDLIVEAAGELLETLRRRPRIIFIDLFCIDDFLGTDDESLAGALAAAYPDTRFAVEHIHPVALNEKVSMGEVDHFNLYSFVDPVPPDEHDGGVNVLGAFVPFNPRSEFFRVLEQMEAGPVRYLHACESFDEYQDMGKSSLALVARALGRAAAEDMRDRLGIPFMSFPACYDCDQVEAAYARMARLLGKPEPDLSEWDRRARSAVKQTVEALGDVPLAVDCEGSLVPHSLARALLDYGFNVRWLFRSKHLFDADADDREVLAARYPDLSIARIDDARLHVGAMVGGRDIRRRKDVLAIGRSAACILDTPYYVDMWHDEGFTGYHGICELMRLMRGQRARMEGKEAAL